jgi:hypothetical protein
MPQGGGGPSTDTPVNGTVSRHADGNEHPMGLANELVEQQIFFRRELSERIGWFIQLRWIAVVCVALGVWAAHRLELQPAIVPIVVVIAASSPTTSCF